MKGLRGVIRKRGEYMLDSFIFKVKRDKKRLLFSLLSPTEARLFYVFLKKLTSSLKEKYKEVLSSKSILIVHDGKEIFREREKLGEIKTVSDMIDVVGGNIKYVIADGEELKDTSKLLENIFILQLCSSCGFLSEQEERKLGRR